MSTDKYFSTIEEFSEKTSVTQLILNAFCEIAPNKHNQVVFIVSAFSAICFSVKIVWFGHVVKVSLVVVGILFNTLLPIFGFLFTIYSLLLGFMSDSYIQELAKINAEKELSFLKKSTSYYLNFRT